MEMNDVFDETGRRTGRIVPRGTKLPPNEYYLAVQVWIRNEVGQYLVQQRSFQHVSSPGVWATTAGYVLAGEESVAGAIREVREELGLQLDFALLSQFAQLKTDHRIEHIWLAEVSRQSIGEPILGPEVAAWKWASKAELTQLIRQGDFFGYSYFATLPD